MAGTDMYNNYKSTWFDPLGPLFSNKYHMYAQGNMYALSARAAAMITNVPLAERRLSGGGDDTSVGLGVLGYHLLHLDDRRLGVFYNGGMCPDNFIGKSLVGATRSKALSCGVVLLMQIVMMCTCIICINRQF